MGPINRWTMGIIGGALALLSPISHLILCAIIFVGIDFVTGVFASRKRAKRIGKKWYFKSEKAWDTITKLVFIMGGICLSHLIDTIILDLLNLHLAKLFTGFACGVEFWSYLENAAEISNHPVFKWLQKFVGNKLRDDAGINIDEVNENKITGASRKTNKKDEQ